MVQTWTEDKPTYSEVDFETMVKAGYRKNEIIFACVSKTANTASQVELKVYSRSDEELPNHPLKAILQRPNPYMSEFDFWSSVILYQKLAGRAIYEKVRSRAGRVVQLWPLRPDWITPIVSSTALIGGYLYEPPGLDPIRLETKDVLDFKLFDPVNLYHGYPPVAVAARVGDVDNAATDYLKLFFEKGGTPPGLLKTTQRLQEAEVVRIRRLWRERYGGHEHWLEPAVLDSDAEYQRIGLDFSEMGFDVLDARNEARICMVLDVPPILIGAKIGLDRATYSNYSEARRAWWEDSLLPLYANFQDVIENQLVPEYGGNVTPEWDYSRVSALQEERNQRWTRATSAASAGLITVNEFCLEVGLPDKGVAGEVYLRGMATVEVPAKTGVRPTVEVEQEMTETAAYIPGGNGKANPPDDRQRRKHEKEIELAMMDYFSGQVKRITSEVRKNGS
jgi:HK97 family phage portal protein